jgi:hypothetical protein
MHSWFDIREFLGSSWGQYLLSWVVAGALMWIGAHLAGLKFASFPRSVVAAVSITFVTWIVAGFLSDSLGIFAFIVSVSLTLVVIKAIFETTWERACLVWVLNALAQFAVISMGYNTGAVQKNALLHYLR